MHRVLLLSCAGLAFGFLGAVQASAQTAEVIHWWTSESESKAINVFASAFKQRGGTWIDNAVVGGQAAQALVMNRLAGGDPPTAMQWNIGVGVTNLAKQDMLNNLDDLAKAGDWEHKLPPLVVKNATYDGHFYAVPTDVHANNWMWFSTKVLDAAHVQPPKTWDEFLDAAAKIKAAGFIPLAQGGEAWQEHLMFESVIIGVAGRDAYRKIFVDHDAKVAGGPGMVKAFEMLRKLHGYTDEGMANRKWNDTARLVATNKAAFQFMGDWSKGEFLAAHLQLGKDIGCALAPGSADAYVLTVDVFAFPRITDPDKIKGQKLLASVMMDPAEQSLFNAYKGALPARLDADVSKLDVCAQMGRKVMADPASNLPNEALAFSPDTYGRLYDVVHQFWNDPSMKAEDAAAQFADIVASES